MNTDRTDQKPPIHSEWIFEFMKEHFTELLLSGLAIFFAALAIWMLKHGAPEDGFKWASGLVGTIVGALLMKMQVAKRDSN
jgi:hypothetical protein